MIEYSQLMASRYTPSSSSKLVLINTGLQSVNNDVSARFETEMIKTSVVLKHYKTRRVFMTGVLLKIENSQPQTPYRSPESIDNISP